MFILAFCRIPAQTTARAETERPRFRGRSASSSPRVTKVQKKTHTIDRIRRRFITTPHCRRHFIRYFRNATGPACRPVKTRNSRCDTAAPRRRAGRAFACGGPQYASSADFALQIRKPPILTTKAFADCTLRTINQNFQLQGITFALGKKQINLHCPRLFVSLTSS